MRCSVMMHAADPPPQIPRSALLLGATASLVACTGRRGVTPTPPPSPRPLPSGVPTPTPSTDPAIVRLLTDAVTVELVLLGTYDDAIARAPRLRATLRAFRAHHSAHAERLSALLPEGEQTTFAEQPPGSDERAILRHLVGAEERAARARVAAAGRAPSGELAVLLAEIAGSEAQHAALLRTIRPRRRR